MENIQPPIPKLDADKGLPSGASGSQSERKNTPQFVNPFPDGLTLSQVGANITQVMSERLGAAASIPTTLDKLWDDPRLTVRERNALKIRASRLLESNGELIPPIPDGEPSNDKLLLEAYISMRKRFVVPAAAQEVGKDAFEKKAERLAQFTRAEGMGYLHGKFPPTLRRQDTEFQTLGGFIQGEEVTVKYGGSFLGAPTDGNEALMELVKEDESGTHEAQEHPHRQIWTARNYIPPQYSERDFVNVRGKHGQKGWVQYDYFMPIDKTHDIGNRPGVYVKLTVAVPPLIAAEMDNALAGNPYFADVYFKALYPGYVGEDSTKQIKREPVTELLVRDLRKNPDPNAGTIISYPKPIQY